MDSMIYSMDSALQTTSKEWIALGHDLQVGLKEMKAFLNASMLMEWFLLVIILLLFGLLFIENEEKEEEEKRPESKLDKIKVQEIIYYLSQFKVIDLRMIFSFSLIKYPKVVCFTVIAVPFKLTFLNFQNVFHKTGYPSAVWFILGNEFCERFSYYGMHGKMHAGSDKEIVFLVD